REQHDRSDDEQQATDDDQGDRVDDDPGDQPQDGARQRAEQEPGALVSAVPRSRLLETETAFHQCRGTQSEAMMLFALALWSTQLMNFLTLPAGAPSVTK